MPNDQANETQTQQTQQTQTVADSTQKVEQTQQTTENKAETVLTATEDKNTTVTVPADWPADWATKLAGDNEENAKVFKRYTSPQNLANALLEAQKKIRSGKVIEELPENATEEQVGAYRKAMGVPEKADGYKLPEGFVPDETMKGQLKGFFEEMHKSNVPAGYAETMTAAYIKRVTDQQNAQDDADVAFKQNSSEVLRKEWGGEHQAHLNAIKGVLAQYPKEVAENLLLGRTADGKRVGDNPEMLRMLLSMAKQINPAATLIPGGIENAQSIDTQIAEMNKLMANPKKWHSKENAPIRAKHLQLIEAQQAFKSQKQA